MKRSLTIFILILLVAAGAVSNLSAEPGKAPKIFIKGSFNLLLPADSDFKDLYGSNMFFPEAKVGFYISKKLYVWGGFGMFSKTASLDVFGTIFDTETKQNFISGGLGYRLQLSKMMDFRIEVGGVRFKYEEEAMEKSVSESAFGFRADLGLTFNFGKNFFAELFAGYMSGSDTVNDFSVKLGGVTSGVGLGVRF